ncbi:hypothetical protein ABZS66_28095 [Dactylosporangium sp. NPDC005572]|uniref:hypothetical protein n=1 Tax=Dactylosporangium sp. NPDC005572 TaxID=3156889 RepID=UPI0033A37FA3
MTNDANSTIGPETGSPAGPRHPDSVLVDELTAFLNSTADPSSGDLMDLVGQLIAGGGRPLLNETWDITADVTEDRYGLLTATVTAGPYTIRVSQPTGGPADLHVAITSSGTEAGRDDWGLAVTVDDRPVLDPMPCTWRSTVPPNLQLTEETRR